MDGDRPERTAAGEPPLHTAVIIGSTREGRLGGEVGAWFSSLLTSRSGFTTEVLDLVEFDLPNLYPAQPTAEVVRFTEALERAEGFVIVTPEYNRSFPASLKQAIDFGYDEWRAKPVGFVSYGSGTTGLNAVEHLRTVFAELHAVTVRDRVGIDLLSDPPYAAMGPHLERTATAMLDQLQWWGLCLREARRRRPYRC